MEVREGGMEGANIGAKYRSPFLREKERPKIDKTPSADPPTLPNILAPPEAVATASDQVT